MRAFGVQLYTLRRPFKSDPTGTLTRIRETGYDSVEFAAPLGMDFKALGQHMRDIGLDCPSAHVGLTDMETRPDEVVAMGHALGCRYLVMPFVDETQRDWSHVIRVLTQFSSIAADAGLKLAYHHHDFEFAGEAKPRPFDRLVAETDPNSVFFELDVFWLKKAGEEPKTVIDALAGRVRLLHLKDFGADGWMTDVGAGALDFPSLIRAGDAAGTEYLFVEHDFPPEPYWPSVASSLAYLRSIS